ncbi:putative Dol-P-Glc:Glc(2)Man(9)GlcNAc(2)-PP-Dol alpha-1,2-glucosyltransferase [Pollicipes pollicipes]|uniref:putative Dol-P-Glc:Glc(2)Man(9)GlcNAc(2)-PP-Dol alpha-1,2-glucosyltransferase n=1 Tax=Pollicipes pollicipes TaxID=41117 RepID=UPI0018857E8E|nr:putative Dol-P-Glc:Glc(2)Man(9)GlcNAc(2)-PP-Dol alpha-1,2-glucosyltransferase [Pollicipes pollicipes]
MQTGRFACSIQEKEQPAMEVKWYTAGLLAAVAVFSGTSLLVFHHVYALQPTPFIDEAFHIPQCQQFCAGNYTQWDPKITTLPGLYLLSVGLLGYLSGLEPPSCTVYLLRMVNLLFSVITLVVIYSILKVLNTEESREWRHLVTSLTLASFPVLYTFSFLYYTDVASTLCVLLMYSLHLHRQPGTAACIGAVAVLVRQTNVIWVGVLAALACSDFMVSTLAASKSAGRRKTVDPCSPRIVRDVLHFYSAHMKKDPLNFAEALTDVLYEGVQYVLVCVGFAAFVVWNGGLVVGDRSAHEAVLNAPQLLYFLATAAGFLAPLTLESADEVAALVPQRLLEFRYFILPFLLLRLHLRPPGALACLAECALYATVNAATLYLFTVKTFTWEDQPGLQRIIW